MKIQGIAQYKPKLLNSSILNKILESDFLNIRKIMCTIMVSMVVLNSSSVFADTLSDQLQQQKTQLQQNKDKLQAAEDRREEIEGTIQKMDAEIEDTMDLIEQYKKQVIETEKEIKNTEVEVKKSEEELKKQQDLLDERMRVLYKNGQVSYFKIVIDASDLQDLFSRVVNMKRMIDYDKKVMADTEAKKQDLNVKKQKLDSQKESIINIKKDSENKLALIGEKSKEQRALIDELKSQEKTFATKVDETQALVNTTLAQIQSIKAAAPKYVPSRGAAPMTDNAIIAYASNFLGTPYLWGGTSPSTGFDCSGFTRYVYAHFGIPLGRTTKDQIHDGTPVSKDQLQTGDLVFFGDNGIPHHMGIYIGNNTYIHSPQTGDVIKVSAMNRKDFITGRRVK
jgi:cell wall-associated NlpC family hydrolase/cell division protein FtsL